MKEEIAFEKETAMRHGVLAAVILNNLKKVALGDPCSLDEIVQFFHFIKISEIEKTLKYLAGKKLIFKGKAGIKYFYSTS